MPLSTYQLTPSGRDGLVIGCGHLHDDAIRDAVDALGRALRRTERSTSSSRQGR